MELFGGLLAIPFILLISVYYPQVIIKVLAKRGALTLLLKAVSCAVICMLAMEAVLLLTLGAVAAHDKFKLYFDLLHTWNVLLGPAAITNVAIIFFKQQISNMQVVRFSSGVVCFLAMTSILANHILVHNAAHYRTDSEGTYRIQE